MTNVICEVKGLEDMRQKVFAIPPKTWFIGRISGTDIFSTFLWTGFVLVDVCQMETWSGFHTDGVVRAMSIEGYKPLTAVEIQGIE
jgi:hypothetical protein